MAILEKEVLVSLKGIAIKHFESLGYSIPKRKTKWGKLQIPENTKILVKINDLMPSSDTELTKICDYCGKVITNQLYRNILKLRNKGNGNDSCNSCNKNQMWETRRTNIKYEKTLEFFTIENNKEYLLEEFSDTNNKNPNEISYGSNIKYWWKCPDCKSEYDMSVKDRIHSRNCPYCAGKRVNQTNCLAKTNPEILDILKNKEIAHKVLAQSNKKEEFICIKCGQIDNKAIFSVVNQGFSCPRCSDGLSYPEKIMFNVLQQLNINFEKEVCFEWSRNIVTNDEILNGDKRYDFFINYNNTIIEVNGIQHYQNVFEKLGGRTLNQEKHNDKLKQILAIENGIKNYITIDCSESDLYYIRNSIMNSELSDMFNLSDIDWLECQEFACNTLVKITCDLWESGVQNTTEISKLIKLSRSTVRNYLKKGAKIGWCKYDPEEAKKENGIILGKNSKGNKKTIVQLTLQNELIREWKCITEACTMLEFNHSNITKVCKGKQKSAGGYKWMYIEDYDQYIEGISNNNLHNLVD